jgi:hypothetical protein
MADTVLSVTHAVSVAVTKIVTAMRVPTAAVAVMPKSEQQRHRKETKRGEGDVKENHWVRLQLVCTSFQTLKSMSGSRKSKAINHGL